MPQVLITGGLGFIGMECCNQFLQHGWTVQILDIKTPTLSQQNWIEGNDVLFIQGDIRVADDVKRSLSGCSAVVNLAAQVSVQRSIALPEETKDINVNGLDVLLKHTIANNVSSFIQASSAAVYGNPTELPLAETAEIECLSPYAESKWENEIQIRTSRGAGLNAISLRFFNVYGPNQNNDSNYASVIPIFIHRMLQGASPIIYGNGEQTRDFIHVHDVAKTIFSMVDGGISFGYSEVNVCSGKCYSLLHLVNCINTQYTRSWNGLWEVQVKVFEPIWRSGVPLNLAQGPPKMAQIGQDVNLKVPVVPNGCNSVEQSWNGI